MRKIRIIGIGAGNPDHLTLQAVAALNGLDVAFLPDKGAEKAELKRLRTAILERHTRTCRKVVVEIPERKSSPSYRDDVEACTRRSRRGTGPPFASTSPRANAAASSFGATPALYDSMIRIVEAIHAGGLALEWDVIPGISAVQALAAAHRVPLNRIGEGVAIVPARRLEEAMAAGIDTMVVVLDGEQAYRRIDGDEIDILWGAYVGMAEERLVSGRLSEVAGEIDRVRQTGRDAMGWIMDSYILRRRRSG